jgi:hypothetical protein
MYYTAVLEYPGTVFLAAKKSRTLQLLAFDEKSTFDFFCFICGNEPRLALSPEIKQTNQKWIVYEKLGVATSEREGKLSNPRVRRGGDAWRKVTKIYVNPRKLAARALCISFLVTKSTVRTHLYFFFFLGGESFFHASTQTRAGALRTSTRTSSRTTTRFQQRQTHVMSQLRAAYAAYRPHQAVQLCWQTLQSMQTLHGRMQCDRCAHLCHDNFSLVIE